MKYRAFILTWISSLLVGVSVISGFRVQEYKAILFGCAAMFFTTAVVRSLLEINKSLEKIIEALKK